MLRPCNRPSVQCFPCADENPLANLTAEIPDRNIYIGVRFRTVHNPPPNRWGANSCVGFCESSVSQLDADDCAQRAALECIPVPPIPTQPPPDDPVWPLIQCNAEQACQDGANCYTVAPCTVHEFSVSEANAIAQSLCDFRVHDPALATPCGAPPPPPPDPETGPTVIYEKAWNEPQRGEFLEGGPCPWPNDFSSTWTNQVPFLCLCQGDDQDPYQWPFGEGSSTSPATTVVQSGILMGVSLDSFVIPDTPSVQNRSSRERPYFRTRIEGGATGKHVKMEGHWGFPGGTWIEGVFNEDTLVFDFTALNSEFRLEFRNDPCTIYSFDENVPQVLLNQALPASGDVLYEFDVPAGQIYYACVRLESATHSNGPSTVILTTTITDL